MKIKLNRKNIQKNKLHEIAILEMFENIKIKSNFLNFYQNITI
jgi:hypothetical protein